MLFLQRVFSKSMERKAIFLHSTPKFSGKVATDYMISYDRNILSHKSLQLLSIIQFFYDDLAIFSTLQGFFVYTP